MSVFVRAMRETAPLSDRLINWSACWRRRMNISDGAVGSAEGGWRSPQQWHALGAPPVSVFIDVNDAQVVESAVQIIDIYHHTLTKAHYIFRWSEPKCLTSARRAAGDRNLRRRGDFGASMAMAHALIAGALELPAVVRRERARAIVAATLHMPRTLTEEA